MEFYMEYNDKRIVDLGSRTTELKNYENSLVDIYSLKHVTIKKKYMNGDVNLYYNDILISFGNVSLGTSNTSTKFPCDIRYNDTSGGVPTSTYYVELGNISDDDVRKVFPAVKQDETAISLGYAVLTTNLPSSPNYNMVLRRNVDGSGNITDYTKWFLTCAKFNNTSGGNYTNTTVEYMYWLQAARFKSPVSIPLYTMPTASASYWGYTLLYEGPTANGFVNNQYYTCIKNNDNTYEWVLKN